MERHGRRQQFGVAGEVTEAAVLTAPHAGSGGFGVGSEAHTHTLKPRGGRAIGVNPAGPCGTRARALGSSPHAVGTAVRTPGRGAAGTLDPAESEPGVDR